MTENAFSSSRPSIFIDGEERPEIQDALTGMIVNLPISGMSHAELNLTNWGLSENATDPDFTFSELTLGQRVEIYMGEGADNLIFDGEITALEECYGQGAPQLVLLLQDKLHRLARKRENRVFEDQTPDDIVQSISSEIGLTADVNISTNSGSYHQLNESDLAFILRLLGRYAISIRIDQGNLRAKAEEADPEPLSLDAQDSALRVRLIADLNHQPKTIRVAGFNPDNGEAIDAASETPSGRVAANAINDLSWPGDEYIPQPFARTQAEADAYSSAHFSRMAKRFISGDIHCQGEPTLRSGREIELAGVSERLLGIYQVVHCTHRFDGSSGYETHLKVNRQEWGA